MRTFTITTTENGGGGTDPSGTSDVANRQAADCTQVALAAELAGKFHDDVRYNPDDSNWLVWDAGWKTDDTGCVLYEHLTGHLQMLSRTTTAGTPAEQRQAKQFSTFIKSQMSARGTKELTALLQKQRKLIVRSTELDANPDLLGTPSGVIELATRTHRAAQRTDLVTRRTGINPDQNSGCPRWKTFLAETISDDPDVLTYLQQLVGYCLTGHTSVEQMWILVGHGSNGKSTFLRTLQTLMGKYATTAAETVLLRSGSSNGANNDVAVLRGARLVTLAETDQDRALNEAKLKQLVSGDVVSARMLYSNFGTFRPTGKLFLATNHLPKVSGTDNGIWRRLVVVPFNRQFNTDPTLERALNAELGAILAWAMQGAAQWYRNGGTLEVPQMFARTTQDYRQQEDHIGRFITERLQDAPGEYLNAQQMRAAYEQWCREEGVNPAKPNAVGARMTRKGWVSKRYGKKRQSHWYGVRLQSHDEDQDAAETPDAPRQGQA